MNKHCLVILASYEYETLQLTLKALDHTIVEQNLPVVIILNGAINYNASKVERIAREWAGSNTNRYVVRPLSAGKEPYFALQEVIKDFPIIQQCDYILKIDDDLIPLKKGWVSDLAKLYNDMENQHGNIGFVTGLINNNSWGFKELVSLYDKWEEYKKFMNFSSLAGGKKERAVNAGEIDTGVNGTVWQYPALAAWLHTWTSFDIPTLIDKTKDLTFKEIDLDLHYSIGCTYSKKDIWLNIVNKKTSFDELLIHEYCRDNKLRKFALLHQPLLHLYYHVQRISNAYLVPDFIKSFSAFFHDSSFEAISQITVEDRIVDMDERTQGMKKLDYRIEKIFTFLQSAKNLVTFRS